MGISTTSKGSNIVGSTWVMKVKRDANGNIDPHKARLVAQGYSQTHPRLRGSILTCSNVYKYKNTTRTILAALRFNFMID